MWVIVSCATFNEESPSVLACPITSYPAGPLDIPIKRTPQNNLNYDSSLLPRMITPILKDELGHPLRRAPKSITEKVIQRLDVILRS